MAINQKIVPADYESQGSTHNSSSSDEESLSCSENEGRHGDIDIIAKSTRGGRRRSRATPSCATPSLRAYPTCGKNSRRARRSPANTIANRHADSYVDSRTVMMMKRLHCQLNCLRSTLPPTTRSCQPHSIIADALRYRKALEKEIEFLLTALPYSKQVDVRVVECGGLRIGISCKKQSGLMVALMEAMESFGLHFSNVSVSCQDENIIIDALTLSTQENVGKAAALKGMLVATITRFNQRQ